MSHSKLQQTKDIEARQINEITRKLQVSAREYIIKDFNPQENILLKIDALKSTRSLSL